MNTDIVKHHPFPFEHPGQHTEWLGGDVWRFKFANDYGASVIRHPTSYGYPQYWELGVLKDGHLTYETPITDDVIGHLDEVAVALLLDAICRL